MFGSIFRQILICLQVAWHDRYFLFHFSGHTLIPKNCFSSSKFDSVSSWFSFRGKRDARLWQGVWNRFPQIGPCVVASAFLIIHIFDVKKNTVRIPLTMLHDVVRWSVPQNVSVEVVCAGFSLSSIYREATGSFHWFKPRANAHVALSLVGREVRQIRRSYDAQRTSDRWVSCYIGVRRN
jgi:hypothetical protein